MNVCEEVRNLGRHLWVGLFGDGRASQRKQKAEEVGLLRRVPDNGRAKQQGRT